MSVKVKKLLKDKKGDAMIIFIAFLILIFGIMTIYYSRVVQLAICRIQLDNALAEAGQKIKHTCFDAYEGPADFEHPFDARNLSFDAFNAQNIAQNTLISHGFIPHDITVTLGGATKPEINIKGKAEVPHLKINETSTTIIPFDYSVRLFKNY